VSGFELEDRVSPGADVGPVTAQALALVLAGGGSLWLRGGPGRGKTRLLDSLAALLAADEQWLTLRLELTEERAPDRLIERLTAALAAVAPEAEAIATPAHEWMAWLDAGPGAAERPALEALCAQRLGLSLADARRRQGPEALVGLLAEHVAAGGLPRPAMRGAAETLAALYDHLIAPAGRRVALLLDDVDAGTCPDCLEVLTALADELPRAYGQVWSVVVTSICEPPAALAGKLAHRRLPPLPPAEELELPVPVTPEAWELLGRLLAGSHRPVPRVRQIVWELASGRAVDALRLAASPSLREWLRPFLPELAAMGAEAATAALESLVAAGEPATPGVALFRAWTQRAQALGFAELLVARRASLRRAAEAVAGAGELVWENLPYAGETLVADDLDPAWGQPLGGELGWRCLLLTRSRLLPPNWPGDARTVLLMPGTATASEREALATELAFAAVAEQHGPAALRATAAAAATIAAGRVRGPLMAYAAGQVVAQPPAAGNWLETLAEVPPHLWPAALLRPRLALVHTERGRWLDSGRLEMPLTAEQANSAVTALRAGLRHPILEALRLAPGDEPPGFADLRRRLAVAGGAIPVGELAAELCGPPHGLTPELARLYLLAFVLRGEPPTRLEVVGPDGLLTALRPAELAAVEIDWRAARRLLRADARAWEEIAPFARVWVAGLPDDANPATRAAARHAVRETLAAQRPVALWLGRQLAYLAQSLGRPLPDETGELLRRWQRLVAAETAEAFGQALADQFEFDLPTWTRAVAQIEGWRRLADLTDELVALHAWLVEARTPSQHPLEADLTAMRAQLSLDRLLAQPHLARGLMAQADQLQRQYAAVYEAAHRDYHGRLARLRTVAAGARQMREALRRLNSLEALGPPLEAGAELDELEPRLEVCRATPELRHRPVCPWCGWRPDRELPQAAVESVRREVEAAFEARGRRLRELLTAEIVAQSGDDRLAALHQVLVLQSAAALPEALTPETVELLRACLPSAARPEVLAELRRRFPTVAAGDVEAVVAALRELLAAATASGAIEL
jgi:hypothetical protein